MAKSTPLRTQAAHAVTSLIARCEQTRPETLPLDQSFVSLDRIDDYLRAYPGESVGVASYVGETLIHHAGGQWEAPKLRSDDGNDSLITKLAIIPKARFYPSEVAHTARRMTRPVIRDAVERHDIQHRRDVLATLVASLPDELEAVRADVDRLTGISLAKLDDSPAVLTAIEDALVALFTKAAPRDEFRQVRARAALFLGDLVRRRIGGDWTVCEVPRVEIGEFVIDGWAPSRPVSNVAAANRGILERTLALLYKRGAAK